MSNKNCSPLNLLVGLGWVLAVWPARTLKDVALHPLTWFVLALAGGVPCLGFGLWVAVQRWLYPPLLVRPFLSDGYLLYLVTGCLFVFGLYWFCIGLRKCCDKGAALRQRKDVTA